ncbi:MAG: esterase family protein [Clostridiales bacterium]|nr:esterase family protein [Clostridiales bacterium]
MAFLQVDFYSNVLGRCTNMNVLLPQGAVSDGDETYPVLYLLHGMSDDHTGWMRRTSIERYAAEKRLAVIMPNAELSFYTNMEHGGAYWTHIAEELPAICHDFFPRLSQKREETYAAGLSMGGYGAFKLALRCPDRFCFAAALSGVLDVQAFIKKAYPERKKALDLVFPDTGVPAEDDLLPLAEKLIDSGKPLPKLYSWCGTEDAIFADTPAVWERLRALGYSITCEATEGDHNWQCWDEKIKTVLAMLP